MCAGEKASRPPIPTWLSENMHYVTGPSTKTLGHVLQYLDHPDSVGLVLSLPESSSVLISTQLQ